MSKTKKPHPPFFVHNLRWFLMNISALHGVNQLANKSGKTLVLWTLVIIGNIILTAAFILIAKHKYDDDAIYTQINANCNVSQVPFPAVSICNYNLVSLRESRTIASLLEEHGIPKSDIDGFFHGLPYLLDYRTNSTKINKYTEIMSILKYHYYSMDTIMSEVHQKCERLLLYCSFNRKEKNCTHIFRMVKTFQGFCCTFNYGGLNDGSDNSFAEEDEDFEYFDDDDEDTGPITHKLIVTNEFGRLSGLYVVFDVEPNDYPTYSIAPNYGAKILVNDPYDYPETTTKYHFSTPGVSIDLKVLPQIFLVQNEIRKVLPSKRKCWFHDEVHLDHTDRYSFETCNTECKMQTYLEHCGCVPYKYPREKFKRICELEDLKCLNNATVHLSTRDMNCHPICYVECSDKKYSTTEDANTIHSEGIPQHITTNRTKIDQLSAVHVYYGKSSCNCYKLTLLIDINYFIATYGGVFSLSFGASIVTVVELLYLIFRFAIIIMYHCVNRIKNK